MTSRIIRRNSSKVSEDARFTMDVVNEAYAAAYDTESEACDNGRFYITRQFETQGILYELAGDWCSAETNEECKAVLRSAYDNANISTGDFVKALMKIIKLSKELLSGAESTGDLTMASVCESASTVNEIHCHVTLLIRVRISHAKSQYRNNRYKKFLFFH